MAPKKQHKGQKKEGKGKSGGAKSAPQVHLSAENERRLRRLLQNNTGRSSSVPWSSGANEGTEAQRTKRLRNIYDKLACEGFISEQIERALSALSGREEITLEAALDWLCLNVPGNELPLQFSSGVSVIEHEDAEKSINVISAARADWISPKTESEEVRERPHSAIAVKIKATPKEEPQTLLQAEEADWIRHYMNQQEELEESKQGTSDEEVCDDSDWEMWTDSSERIRRKQNRSVVDPETRALSAAAEFQAARQAAMEAKKNGDKQRQELAGRLIRELKQEMISLGLSEEVLCRTVSSISPATQDNTQTADLALSKKERVSVVGTGEEIVDAISVGHYPDHEVEVAQTSLLEVAKSSTFEDGVILENNLANKDSEIPNVSKENPIVANVVTREEDEQEVEEMLGLFDEEIFPGENMPQSVLEMQKKEKAIAYAQGQTLERSQDKWRKGGKSTSQEESTKQPKAILQQQCQKSGWEAPKYEKLSGRGNAFLYSLTIIRPTSGRGKNKKFGGPITVQFPDQDYIFESADDAQNGVAMFALVRLFPELPLYQIVAEPYKSLCVKWLANGQETSNQEQESEDVRRSSFVKSLVTIDTSYTKTNVEKVEHLDHEHANLNSDEKKMVPNKLKEERLGSHKVAESFVLKRDLEEKMKMKKYKMTQEYRASLPMAGSKELLLELMKQNDVIVVSGETGCGKTTQVPQYILDDMIQTRQGGLCNIICTQPRRIAAISVAERVADERCEPPPGSNGSLVGYQVRLDSAWNPRTRLLFCTTGILLRKLAGDRDLDDVSHIVVDEVHERSVLGDFLLINLKEILERKSVSKSSKLKLVLMSATVDASLFSHYFGDCPVISVKGRTHPVTSFFLEDVYDSLEYHLASDSPAVLTNSTLPKKKFAKNLLDNRHGRQILIQSGWGDETVLEEDLLNPNYDENLYNGYTERTRQNLKKLNEEVIDYDLLEDLVRHIDKNYEPGAMLVFLPGMAEIQLLMDRLAVSYQFGGIASEWLLALHSSIAPAEQRKVFSSPPENVRKIVVATNIAETSITIDDVVYVIDSGKHKENRYNPQRRMSSMVEAWISQANVKQRCGRAGRVKPGICFCLYTRHRYEQILRPFQVPEMLRVPLVELCLQIKSMSLGDVVSFLGKAIQPPREESVNSAVAVLYEVGALEGKEELTALGYHLAKLPVDVRIGKMMLYGTIFGCLDPILTIAACLSHKSPFVSPKDEKNNAERAKLSLSSEGGSRQNIASGQQSDHLLLVAAYDRWVKILRQRGATGAREFCKSYFLNSPALYMIRDMRIQFGSLLADIGFIKFPKVESRKREEIDKWLNDLSQPFNIHSQHASIVKSTLCAGLYPNVAAMEEESIKAGHAGGLTYRAGLAPASRPRWYDRQREVFVHPTSINSTASEFHHPFMVFLEKVETSKVFLRDTTIISPYALLLFGGSINIQHQTGSVTIDGWLKMNATAQTAVIFKELRLALHSILQELIQKPKERGAAAEREIVHSIVKLLIDEEKAQH